MIEYDLHIHTKASDGLLEPDRIFQIAKEKKLKGLSITDHDTIDSLEICNYLSKKYNLYFIPGIELSSFFKGLEIHILGYYIDYKNEELLNLLKRLQLSRIQRANKIVDKIQKLGYDIKINEVELEAGNINSLGRPHIGRVLVKKGYFKDTSEAFDKLLESGKPGYVERYKLETKEAIDFIKKSGGIPVIAHPFIINKNLDIWDIKNVIINLKEYGAAGIEVYHSLQSRNQSDKLYEIAIQENMIITGGSDCHGIFYNGDYILGKYGVNSCHIEKLKALKR
ncbi:MAG: PHP domain-containing protein [Caloramator sp.]|nr:PHP domain-containing protein [Caloramator sp.]